MVSQFPQGDDVDVVSGVEFVDEGEDFVEFPGFVDADFLARCAFNFFFFLFLDYFITAEKGGVARAGSPQPDSRIGACLFYWCLSFV